MSATQICHTVMQATRQLRPHERVTRPWVNVWTIAGIYLSRKIHMCNIAGKIPGRATANSKMLRLSRFLDNPGRAVNDVSGKREGCLKPQRTSRGKFAWCWVAPRSALGINC